MAGNKIIREARSFQQTSTDRFAVKYNIPEQHVDFPFVALIIFIVIDIIDILILFSVIGIPFWGAFTLIIVLPIQIWYLGHREKKYSGGNIDFSFLATQGGYRTEMSPESVNSSGKNSSFSDEYWEGRNVARMRDKISEIRKLNQEASQLMKQGKMAEAAEKLGNVKKVLPLGLRWLTVLVEKVWILNALPLNTIIILMSYYDNKETARAVAEGYKVMARTFSFKIDRKTTRTAGSTR